LGALESGGSAAPQAAHIVVGQAVALPQVPLDTYSSLYRRPVPDDQIVNILPQLAWQ
jgi:hypothetical protein